MLSITRKGKIDLMDDVGRLWVGIVICAAVVLVMGFLTACENAAVEFNDAKLKKMAEDKDPKAVRLAGILKQPGRVVVTNLIARSIMIIVISVICTVYFFAPLSEYFAKLFGAEPESGAYYGVCVGTFFIISCLLALAVCTFGISIPKKLCVSGKIGESFILNAGGIYRGFLAAFRPLEAVSGLISKGILRLFGVKNIGRNDAVTEEEILMMVDAVNETGGIEESQAEMISNIFDFDDIEVREVMTHRTEMVAIEENAPVTEAVKLVMDEGFSRIPVYCDNPDNISGVIFAKDLLKLVLDENKKEQPVSDFMREVRFVPESNKCGELFEEFTDQKTQIAVVVDDYGGTAGIITMEDLLETIVGNIQDEYDDEAEEIQQVSPNTFDLLGNAGFDNVMEALDKEYSGNNDYDTIGGFVIDLLGHIPEENEHGTVSWENVEFKILSVHDKKIERLRAVVKENENNDAQEK